MKKVLFIFSLIILFYGCALDESLESTNPMGTKARRVEKEKEYIYVTIDEFGNVYDLEGNTIDIPN